MLSIFFKKKSAAQPKPAYCDIPLSRLSASVRAYHLEGDDGKINPEQLGQYWVQLGRGLSIQSKQHPLENNPNQLIAFASTIHGIGNQIYHTDRPNSVVLSRDALSSLYKLSMSLDDLRLAIMSQAETPPVQTSNGKILPIFKSLKEAHRIRSIDLATKTELLKISLQRELFEFSPESEEMTQSEDFIRSL